LLGGLHASLPRRRCAETARAADHWRPMRAYLTVTAMAVGLLAVWAVVETLV
jgi:hypothetical protein